ARWTDNFLNEQRTKSDELADALIRDLTSRQKLDQLGILMRLESNADPIPEALDPALLIFLETCSALPSWADEAKIRRAESFFEEYQVYVYMALLFASLPYCYAAAD